jgi:hypothetical protein
MACPKGHLYTESNTYINPLGGRQCRKCNRARFPGRERRLPNVRYNAQDGALDEVAVGRCQAHLEQMDERGWFLGLALPNGRIINVWLTSTADITARVEDTKQEREDA